MPVPAAWLAIYLPVWKNLHTGKILYSITWVLLILVYAQETTGGNSLLGLLG